MWLYRHGVIWLPVRNVAAWLDKITLPVGLGNTYAEGTSFQTTTLQHAYSGKSYIVIQFTVNNTSIDHAHPTACLLPSDGQQVFYNIYQCLPYVGGTSLR